MINGIINIYKEAGFTSFDVVAKLRGIVKQKKIGHTGTLDPDAVGVLPVCFGNATKLCDMLTDKSKEYEAVMLLGVTTDTQDISGTVLRKSEVKVDEETLREVIASFVGSYDQIPPMYSALKVDGKRLYELARQGIEVERKARHVEIDYIDIKEVNLPEVRFVVGCSKGTYIRTLCVDIGEWLGCGATMKSLIRTRVGGFTLENALTLSQVEELVKTQSLDAHILCSDEVFKDVPGAFVKSDFDKVLANGNKMSVGMMTFEEEMDFADGQWIRVYTSTGEFRAIYEYKMTENIFKPYKMFM